MLDKEEFDDYFGKATLVIAHAGMGTIDMAMNTSKPILVIPRRKEFGEHVNDHQVWTARKFAELGHIVYCDELGDLPSLARKIEEAKVFVGKKRVNRANDLAGDIVAYLHSMEERS